ncbi:hypothetical protein ACVWYH_005305 [Bradyrhizobium sp. GM24.11]
MLEITESQWLILMAIDELGEGRGVSGIAVAKLEYLPLSLPIKQRNLKR